MKYEKAGWKNHKSPRSLANPYGQIINKAAPRDAENRFLYTYPISPSLPASSVCAAVTHSSMFFFDTNILYKLRTNASSVIMALFARLKRLMMHLPKLCHNPVRTPFEKNLLKASTYPPFTTGYNASNTTGTKRYATAEVNSTPALFSFKNTPANTHITENTGTSARLTFSKILNL